MNNTLVSYLVILGPILIFYFILIQLRRLKYKKIASELNANYVSQGIFANGEIEGIRNGRKFSIQNVKSRVGGRSSTFWTVFSISCNNRGIPLHIYSEFFKKFPDWKFAFTKGDKKERAFITYLNFKNVDIPLEEKYRLQVCNLFQDPSILNNDITKRGLIEIEKDKVTFSMHCLLKKTDMMQQAISFIEKIAKRIEAAAVV